MELQGVNDKWLIENYKEIAQHATKQNKDWEVCGDFRTRLSALDSLAKMAKKTGSTEGISSTAKQLMVAQWAISGDETVYNFTKMLFDN